MTTFFVGSILLALLLGVLSFGNAFTSTAMGGDRTRRFTTQSSFSTTMASESSWVYQYSSVTGSTVIDAPTKEDVDTRTRRRTGNGDDRDLGDLEENLDDDIRKHGPLEWLEDMEVSRDMEDPFHILLLGQTFEKPKITVPYVASSLEYVLDMPVDEATELSQFSHDHGISCLGVWPREECLRLGKQLQIRDIVCRIVPYVEGGQRAWQAKDASLGVSRNNSS
ncbi:hypothetical protein IV203_018312 [Nitzschia inconspicua]|uniref:Uncharacterized protein n=1 Tax=Nitzschia inconspicua TaxID=303405 RepID=A0A9K3M188_9STRA|nr:hypothetical protein IV203_018312 [Nitzschia inconspicua]